MIRATTKNRKKLFYNRITESLMVETKPGSNYFKGQDDPCEDIYHIDTISEWYIYTDLSLFPAHIFKNYGKITQFLKLNDIVWVHNKNVNTGKPDFKKPFLAIISKVSQCEGMTPERYQFKKISINGVVLKKTIYETDKYLFSKPLENYKIETKIKLI